MLILIVGALGFAAGCDFSFCGKKCDQHTQADKSTACCSCESHGAAPEVQESVAQEALASDEAGDDAVSDNQVSAAVEASE